MATIRLTSSTYYLSDSSYLQIIDAENEVTYILPNPWIITTSLSDNETINPSGINTYYDDSWVEQLDIASVFSTSANYVKSN